MNQPQLGMSEEPPELLGMRLTAQGYRRVSARHRLVARVDREDWQEFMAQKHAPWNVEEGREWVRLLGKGAADFYRRIYSKDTLAVGDWRAFKFIPGSNWDSTGFVKKG